jgi:hypothetical protein
MPHFIDIFFNRYASEFNFLDHEETLTKVKEQTLSPLLSSCIAAITAGYVHVYPSLGSSLLIAKLSGMLPTLKLIYSSFMW